MEVLVWPADLTREAEVTALLGAIAARYGRLDLLFNNAGVNVPPTPFGEMGLKEWRHVIDTNLTAAFHVAQQADISPVSRLHLAYISPTSPLHLPYISATSHGLARGAAGLPPHGAPAAAGWPHHQQRLRLGPG